MKDYQGSKMNSLPTWMKKMNQERFS